MKALKNLIIAITILFGFNIVNAQHITIKLYPRHGVFIKKLNRPRLIRYSSHKYYTSRGIWYKKRNRSFVVIQAPIGLRFKVLPRGSRVIWINRYKYYTYRGIRYARTRKGFIIVS